MKTLTDNYTSESGRNVKYYTIAGDVLLDILYILFSNNIRYEIKSVNRDESSILLYIPLEKQPPQIIEAAENIDSILASYKEYIIGLPPDALHEKDADIF